MDILDTCDWSFCTSAPSIALGVAALECANNPEFLFDFLNDDYQFPAPSAPQQQEQEHQQQASHELFASNNNAFLTPQEIEYSTPIASNFSIDVPAIDTSKGSKKRKQSMDTEYTPAQDSTEEDDDDDADFVVEEEDEYVPIVANTTLPQQQQQVAPQFKTREPTTAHRKSSIEPNELAQMPIFTGISLCVRGARKTQYDNVESLTELNSLPYKYCWKIDVPACEEDSPNATLRAEHLKFDLICNDPDRMIRFETENGLVVDKNCKTKTFADGRKEFDFKAYLQAYSHAYNRGTFEIQIMDSRNGRILFRSSAKPIFARRNRSSPTKRKRNPNTLCSPSKKKRLQF